MNPRHLELADEFCKLVGTAHLIEYLGLEPGVSPDEARTALKKRRKYMQGMQSNPKYKNEALFLIKNLPAFEQLLADPGTYLEAVSRQQESAHLPILEMTIRTVLKGGNLALEQEEYLRRQARELGLSEQTFEDTITRLAAQAGIRRPSAGDDAEADEDLSDDNVEITDHYGLLGLQPAATREEIYDAYRARYRTVRAMADRERADTLYKRLDRAWQVLSDNSSRETYDLSLRQTGPPARDRNKEDPFAEALRLAPTAPPVKDRERGPPRTPTDPAPTPVSQPGRSRIEFVGPRVRQIRLAGQAFEATLEVSISDGAEARVSTDEPWLRADPPRLSGDRREHEIRIRIDPDDLPERSGTGVVTVQTEIGDRASLVFEVRRSRSLIPLVAGVLGFAGLGAGLLAVGTAQGWFAPTDRSVTLTVDPTSEEVLLDGVSVGGGARVVIPEPPEGPVTLTVLQPNFETWIQQVDLSAHAGSTFEVRLDLEAELDFVPGEDDTQGTADERAVQRVMTPRSRAMDECVRQAAKGGPLSGKVRIFIGPEGHAAGVEMEGGGTEDPVVRGCLVRQAAAIHLPAVQDGDYAVVRYDYEVAAEGGP